MPSAVFKYVSEPVHLTNHGDDPYKPPQELESSPHAIQNAKAYILSGLQEEEKSNGKVQMGPAIDTGDGFTEGAGKEKVRSSTESHHRSRSRKNSEQTITTAANVSSTKTVNGLDNANGKAVLASRSGTAQTQEPKKQLQALKNIDIAPPQIPGVKGHGRAHSSSSPATPTSFLSSLVGPDGAQSHFQQPTSARNSSVSLNKSGLPSGYAGPASKSAHPIAPKLVSRHTLEVPRVSTSRSSRDFSYPGTTSDAASDLGRLSPSPRTPRVSNTLMRPGTRSMQSDAFLDETPQDGEMARWTEQVRAKRASRRKRKEEEEDDRVIVGTKVDKDHANWITAYNMLTGIRFTVSRTNAKIDRELTDADFDAKHKLSFDV